MPRLKAAAWRFAKASRGLTDAELRRRHGLSKPTLSALNHGREVSAGTLRRVDAILRTTPVLEEVASLLDNESAYEENHQVVQSLVVEEAGPNGTARLRDPG